MQISCWRLLCSCCLSILLVSGALHGQLTRGFVSGLLTDPSGAVIPAARVRITNTATNEQRQVVTNAVGAYRFVALEPGTYDMEFSATGFEAVAVRGLRVGPAEEVVLNKTMTLAGAESSIEVREEMPVSGLARASATIERTLESESVRALPLGGTARDATRLALLSATAVRAPGSSEVSASGQRARQNNFLLDGTDNNDLTVTVPSARIVPEAVAEFQIQATPYSAEFGRNTGAQISILTPSGTNAFHGEIWDYFRANWLEPLSLLNKRAAARENPRFVHNQAGASLGGPLTRNRTFFFGLLDANRRRDARDARNAQPVTLPTPAGFAALATVPLGQGQPMESRQAVLDALKFLPEVYEEISAFEPATPQIVNGVPIEMGTTRVPLANPHDFWLGLVRLEHRVREADVLSYRLLLDKRAQPDVAGNRQFGSRFTAASAFLSQNHSWGLTHASGSDWVDEFRFAYIRSNADFPENDPTSANVQVSGAFTLGGASTFPQGRLSNVLQAQNVFTRMLGRHSLRFGGDLRWNRLSNRTSFDAKGSWIFQNFADFLNNRASSLRQSLTDSSFDARQSNQFYFFQDDIKVNRMLTLSVGLRYEYSSVPFGFFGAASPEIAAAGVPLPACPDRNNLAPRFGFAYSPGSSGRWMQRLFGEHLTVFRGGFGMAYDVIFYNVLTNTALNYPRVLRSEILQPQTINLFPTLAPKQTTFPPFDPLMSFVNVPTDAQNPTTRFWTFSVQRQFGRNYLLELGYSANRSYHLLRLSEKNPGTLTEEQAQRVKESGSSLAAGSLQQRRLNPAWGSRASIESTALSQYDALYLRFDRKMAGGLLVGANYTWSGTFSDNDEPLAIGDIVLSSPHAPQDFFNYRNEWSRSVFDRPQRLAIHYVFEPANGSINSSAPSPLRYIASGWQVGGTIEWQSGQPFTVRTGVDSGGSGFGIAWRPDYNPDGVIAKDPDQDNFRTFSTPGGDVFLTPMVGNLPLANSMPQGGNLGRNTFRGPGYANWSLSVAKKLPVSQRLTAQLRADYFNLWNHRNFGNPVATMNSSAFGTNSTDPGGRTMLLGLKFSF